MMPCRSWDGRGNRDAVPLRTTGTENRTVDDSTKNHGVVLRIDAPDGSRALVLEDDGKVAYAYLLEQGGVVGDVWLYNVAETPESVDWRDEAAMPFLNPRRYCRGETVARLRDDSAVACEWSSQGVVVVVDGVRLARLERGAKPGWSRLAGLPGPLAKPLEGVWSHQQP